MENFYFKNIKISCCDLKSSIDKTIFNIKLNKPNYICVTDVGNLINAHNKSQELKEAINGSFLSLPDGRPLSVFAKLKGVKNIDRVAGPDFMQGIFSKTSGTNITHFFLGDTNETHIRLKQKISEDYSLKIVGCYSPSFQNWNSETDEKIIDEINTVTPDIIWVSLGGGKQEIWMKDNYKKLNKGILIGVGASFRFYIGEIKRAPYIFQRLGFEWFFRLIQQPKKMFIRYMLTLPFFVYYSMQEFFVNKSETKKILST